MKITSFSCILLVLFGDNCSSESPFGRNAFPEVDFLLESTSRKDLKEALSILESLNSEEKDNWEYLLKMAETNWKLALNGRSDISYDEKEELYMKAHDYAEKAMDKNDNSPDVEKWYAVTLGSLGDYVSLKQKVKDGKSFEKHIKRALKMTHSDPHIYHLYGRFCFEVSELSWLERTIASALFDSVPESTKEEALLYFKEAEKLDEDWGENNLFIAECYISLKQYEKAAHYLERASVATPRSTDSDKTNEKIQNLMKNIKHISESSVEG